MSRRWSCVLFLCAAFGLAREARPGAIMNNNFEWGTTVGWVTTGTAFNNQPTYGDNPNARTWPPIGIEGQYFVGTYENRHTPSDPAGGVQGDVPTGTLTSKPFRLQSGTIDFLIGGGSHPWTPTWTAGNGPTCVNLERPDGTVLFTATGPNSEVMSRVTWDASAYVGQVLQIKAYDENSGGWGHPNFDDVRANVSYFLPYVPNSDFETGDLTGWTQINGSAFSSQPTYGDNPAARGFPWSYGINPLWPNQTGVHGDYFVGTYENRHTPSDPAGGIQGDGPMGVLESDPFELIVPTITVRVGGGNHPWPTGYVWNESSLGWTAGTGPTCINLERLDGTVLFTATGRNTEAMWDEVWDTSAYRGEILRFRIYDQHSGGWGHVNVDYINFVPEPGTFVLLLSAAAGLGLLALRRRVF